MLVRKENGILKWGRKGYLNWVKKKGGISKPA